MEGMPEDMWSAFKQLYHTIQGWLSNQNNSTINMELCLKKYKQNFTNFLRNPPKNEKSRNHLRNSLTEGAFVGSLGRKVPVSKDLIDEALILSDMFDMDELIALELLCTAQRQLPHHPGLPRGLVAVLLYYDGRKAISCALRDLFQVTSGVSWSAESPREITSLISSFTQNLVDDSNILARIIELLEDQLDITKETEMLTKNRAFGPKKHQNQVLGLFKDIRLALAMALFNWSAQRGLPKAIAIRLLQYLHKYKTSEASGVTDDVSVTLLMAFIYSFDTSVLQRQEDNNMNVQRLPIFSDPDFVQQIYDKLNAQRTGQVNSWHNNHLDSLIKFCFGLTLASLRHAPANLQAGVNPIIDHDEQLIDEALASGVFEYIYHSLLENEIIFKTEFFYRRIHMIFTDFIDFMHSKVTELRGRAGETARTKLSFQKEDLEPPQNLDNNFEVLMQCIGKLYKDNPCHLALCEEYWGPSVESSSNDSYIKSTTRSVSLFKFVRLASELLPSTLFVAYLRMITGLTSSERSARTAYNLLKVTQHTPATTSLSWDHFFGSISNYYANLRQENYLSSDTIYRNRSFNRCIKPAEIECLHAVLGIINAVAKYDEVSRIIFCQQSNWAPIQLLIGLLSCSVPLSLKAEILFTLASLAKSVETSITVWNCLEDSQIIPTIPITSTYGQCSLEEEIEQSECRSETFGLTRGILDLLHTLVTTHLPRSLGNGSRKPGFDPYLTFVVKTIFLKFYNRSYKNDPEKWEVGAKCLKLLYYLLESYEPHPQDFNELREQNPDPGYHIMLQLQVKSDMLRLILLLIEDARLRIEDYSNFRGKDHVEECALYCLLILEQGLAKQNAFLDAHSSSNSSVLLSGLNRMMLDINPRTRQPDYILNTNKYVTFNSWLPRHTLTAIKILKTVILLPNVSTQILGMYGESSTIKLEIRQGFVECLELDIGASATKDDELNENGTNGDIQANTMVPEHNARIELQIKAAIVEFLEHCITQQMPNFGYFLLGFDGQRDGVNRFSQSAIENGINCTKSLVYLLEQNLEVQKTSDSFNEDTEHINERIWHLVYSLYGNRRTSESILRYLRTCCNDFLLRHLNALPYKHGQETTIINQMSHVLKCVSIELKLAATHGQISRFHNICEILVGNGDSQRQSNIPIEYSNFLLQSSVLKPETGTAGLHICRLLDNVSLKPKSTSVPKTEFFESSLLLQIITECKSKVQNSCVLINVKQLNGILNDELSTVQSTIAAGQRQLILQEIKSVLLYAISLNCESSQRFATVKYMEAWSQITQTLFTCVPDSALPLGTRKKYIIDILERIFNKILPVQPLREIALLGTDTVLLLMAHLRYCYYQLEDAAVVDNEQDKVHNETDASETLLAKNSGKSNTAHLRYILKSVLEWIMVDDVSPQKLRINLYTALLSCLRIMKRYRTDEQLEYGETYISLLDKSKANNEANFADANHVRMAVEVVSSFGEKLIDTFCHDAISGHNVCRMLALSCLDIILELDPLPSLINFIATRGYLTHIIEALLNSDSALIETLREKPASLKALYIYESEMAFLLRLSNSHIGAELLLFEKLLAVLSNMKVYDMQPDLKANALQRKEHMNDFVPGIDDRYRSILFPALDICDSLITTLGTENNSLSTQIMNFLFSHSDMVETVLRTGTPFMDLGFLKELSAITNIIARTATRESTFPVECNLDPLRDESNYDNDVKNRVCRVQQLMMTIFGRFVMNDATIKNMLKPENVIYEHTEENKSLHVKYFLEISANLALYARNLITSRNSDSKLSKYMLTTVISDVTPLGGESGNPKKLTVVLTVVLNQLKGSVSYYLSQKSVADNLQQQRSSLPNISFDPNAKQRYLELTQRYNDKHNDLTLAVFICEQSLYLLWLHLDYYLRRAIIFSMENKISINENTQDNSNALTATYEEILALKKTLLSVFNETFCQQLLSTSELATVAKGFNETLLRRIKKLIQFVPVN